MTSSNQTSSAEVSAFLARSRPKGTMHRRVQNNATQIGNTQNLGFDFDLNHRTQVAKKSGSGLLYGCIEQTLQRIKNGTDYRLVETVIG